MLELTKKTRVQENRFFFPCWLDQDAMSGTAILEGRGTVRKCDFLSEGEPSVMQEESAVCGGSSDMREELV